MVDIRPLTEPAELAAAAALFAGSVDASYISHSELMYGRARSQGQWVTDLDQVLRHEFAAMAGPAPHPRQAFGAFDGTDLAGVAVLYIDQTAPTPFGILEDAIVAPAHRRKGVLRALVRHLEQVLRTRGITRLFLESGVGNHGAHDAFEELGFGQVSIVMMKDLP